jgi:hypothetical protein
VGGLKIYLPPQAKKGSDNLRKMVKGFNPSAIASRPA